MKIEVITDRLCVEDEILNEYLEFDNKNILELGCGAAQITRKIASTGSNRTLVATEVDKIQHEKNLQIDDLPNVTFVMAGSQDLPFEDNSFDIILLFKSLHHVPEHSMQKAMSEIARVLKPGGKAYISEPIFAGEFNEVLRLFHDEQQVRQSAFEAIVDSVDKEELNLVEQIFFNTPRVFENFEQFENQVINVTHTEHKIAEDKMKTIRDTFSPHMTDDGAHFQIPIRVDLLTKQTS